MKPGQSEQLHIVLLGQCRLGPGHAANAWLSIASPHQRALLAFLALQPNAISREQLATLLWGDKPDYQARQSLRQLLLEFRKHLSPLGVDILIAERSHVALNRNLVASIDVEEFRELAVADSVTELRRAAVLYSGDLLDDLYLDVETFDAWAASERERLRATAAEVFRRLALAHDARGRGAEAVTMAERLVALDPADESSHRFLIRQLALHRGADAALAHGARFIRQLAEDLDAEPEAETSILVSAIRTGTIARTPAGPIPTKPATSTADGGDERKLITVWSARLDESLRLLAARDAEEARSLIDPVLEIMIDAVRHYGGTVNQVLTGGVVALFGVPLTHEDHAARASLAALRTLENMRAHAETLRDADAGAARIRIGIATGEVVVRGTSDPARPGYTVIGAVGELVGELARTAAAETILANGAAAALVQGQIETIPMGSVSIAGLPVPLPLHRIVRAIGGTRIAHAAAAGLTPLTARERELEQLIVALARVRRGRGRIVAVSGEPGIGKSRLCWEFLHAPATRGWLVLRGRAVSHGQTRFLLPIIGLLTSWFHITNDDDAVAMREKIDERLRSFDDRPAGIEAAIRSLFDLPVGDDAWEGLPPRRRRAAILDGLKWLLIRISEMVPLIIHIEDLHWADPDTHTLLDGLAGSLGKSRILLMVDHRPEYRWPRDKRLHYQQLHLVPLPAPAAEVMLAALIGRDVSLDRVRGAILARTEGNPLFIEETVRAMAETGVLAGEKGAYRSDGLEERIPISADVRGILASRVDRLAAEDKRLLQAAAVIGKDCPLALLRGIANLSEPDLRDALDRLRSAEFLHPLASRERIYTFRHALTYDVAYQNILRGRRRDLHARVVAAIERLYTGRLDEHVDELARHAEQGELWAKAVLHRRRAAAKQLGRSSYREAKLSLDRALSALARLPVSKETTQQAISIRMELRLALLPLGDQVGLERILREARALATSLGDNGTLGRIVNFVSSVHNSRGENEQGLALGTDSARMSGDAGTRALGIFQMGTHSQALGRYGESLPWFREAIATVGGSLLHERFDQVVLPSVVSRAGLAISLAEMGQFDEALAIGKETLHIAEAPRSRAADLVVALMGLGRPYLRRGDVANAQQAYERAMRICREVELSHYLVAVAPALGATYVLTGRAEAAIALVEPVKELHEKMSMLTVYAFTISVLSEATFATGDVERAIDLARHGLAFARDRRHRGWEAWTLRLLGQIASCRSPSDREEAVGWYEQGLALAIQCEMRPLIAHCHVALGHLNRLAPAPRMATEHLAVGLRMYREMDMRLWFERG